MDNPRRKGISNPPRQLHNGRSRDEQRPRRPVLHLLRAPAGPLLRLHPLPGLQHDNFAGEPRVVRSEKQFLLLHLPLNWSSTSFVRRSSEYFVYQAIPGRPPTLSRIPDPPGRSFLVAQDLGIHCCGDNDGEYILAGLCPSRDDAQGGYELHLYSSVSREWTRN
ncbi:hypothetical protein ZWY2020_023321 [Hordeum vulgare]|nr:hypothetical protein ZWY2020_023321 [Hordeum vulgare]